MSTFISSHTQTPFIHQNSSTSSSSNSPASSSEGSSPFSHCRTAQEKLLHFLFIKGVIDEAGRLKDRVNISNAISLDAIQQKALTKILDKEISVAVHNHSFKTTLRKLLAFIETQSSTIIPKIEIVGGFVRKLLLLSTESVVHSLSTLTGIPEKELRPFITDELLRERKREIPDIDVRIHAPNAEKKDLYAFTNSVVNYFSQNLAMNPYTVKQGAFSKFNAVCDNKNQFSIATFQPTGEKVPEIELLFVKNFLRDHLFVHDALRIPLGKTPSIEGEIKNGWQSFIDLLTRTIHIANPKTVDLFGFPVLMSYFSRGYVSEDQNDLDTLIKKVTTLSQYQVGIPGQIVGLLSTSLRNHHVNDPNAAIVMTINACTHLNLSRLEMREIWNQMAKKHWSDHGTFSDPILKEIDHAIRFDKVPFKKVMHAVALRAYMQDSPTRTHCKKAAFQLPISGTGYRLLLPGNSLESVKAIEKHFSESKTRKPLLQLIGTHIKEIDQGLKHEALSLLDSKQRTSRYLGFLLLLKNGGPLSPLLTHFIDIYTLADAASKKSLSSALDHLIGQPAAGKLSETTSEVKLLNQWILTLAKIPTLTQSALQLWKAYHKKIPSKLRMETEKILIKSALAHWPHKALDLFENSHPAQQTFSLLGTLVSRVNQDHQSFSTLSKQTSQVLSQFLSKKHKNPASKDFYSAFSTFIHSQLKDGQLIHARTLLELASVQQSITNSHPEIQKAWISLTQASIDRPKEALAIWEKGESINLWKRTPPVLEAHLFLIERLIQNVSTQPAAVRHLKAVAKDVSDHPKVQELAIRHIKGLIEEGDGKKALNRLKRFKAHLSPKQQAEIRQYLYHHYMQKGEYLEASTLCPLLKNQSQGDLHQLLEALTSEQAKEPLLKAATHLLTSGAADKLLTVNQQVSYLFSIYERSPTRRFLRYLLGKTDSSDVSNENRYAFVKQLITALNDGKGISSALGTIISNKLPSIQRVIQEKGNPEELSDLYRGLDIHKIDYKNSGEFQQLCTTQISHYCELQDNERALTWIDRSLSFSDSHFLSNWCPKLLDMLNLEIKSIVLQKHRTLLLNALEPQRFLSTTIELFEQKKLSATHVIDYLEHHPSHNAAPWLSLIRHGKKEMLPVIWEKFTTWFKKGHPSNAQLRQCWMDAADRIENEKHQVPLLEWIPKITEQHWVLESLFPSESILRLNFCRTLMKALANHPDNAKHLSDFFDWVHVQYPFSKHPEKQQEIVYDLILRLKSGTLSQFKLACFLINFTVIQLKDTPDKFKEKTYQQFASLASKGKNLHLDHEAVQYLLVATKLLHQEFSEQINLLEIASSFATYPNKNILLTAHVLLKDCPNSNAKKALYSTLIPNMMQYGFDWTNQTEQLQALNYLNKYLEKLYTFPEAYEKATNMAQSLIVKQLDNPSRLDYFCDYFSMFLVRTHPSPNTFNIIFERPVKGSTYVIPIIVCTDKTSTNKAALDTLFFQTKSILEKVLDSKTENNDKELYTHCFIRRNLLSLCMSFPEQKKQLADLIDRFIFRYTPDDTPFYTKHLTQADKLMTEAISEGIYKGQIEKAIESIYYIGLNVVTMENFPAKAQTKILKRVIERVLLFDTPQATLRALFIMSVAQKSVVPDDNKLIKELYSQLFSKLSLDPFYTYRGQTLFEWARHILMSHPHIIRSPETSLYLYSKLFEKVYSAYQDPKKQPKEGYSKSIVLKWLGKFLFSTRQIEGFEDIQSIPKYFKFSEIITKSVLSDFSNFSPKQQRQISTLISRVIAWERKVGNQKLFKKFQKIRCSQASQWIKGLLETDSPEIAQTEFRDLENIGIFYKFRKEQKQLQSLIKSKEKVIIESIQSKRRATGTSLNPTPNPLLYTHQKTGNNASSSRSNY